MQTVLLTAVLVLGGLLLAFATYAMFVGLVGAATGERFERCECCGHRGLTIGGRRHASGCPAGLAGAWHPFHPAH